MTVENEKDLIGLMRIGKLCAETMQHMAKHLKPGITTRELDDIGADYLEKHGARSAPIITYQFPGATCISINEEVAHGIPGSRVVQPGDMVNIDVSAALDGYYADTGATYLVPPNTPEQERICNFTKRALEKAIEVVRDGVPLHVIGKAVEKEARAGGYSIIRELGGHGVGRALHEEPRNVPNFFNPRARSVLREGMVLTLEPFLNTGRGRIITGDDNWTLKTTDGSLSAQYEHTVIITKDRPILVTALA
jgi:methionyl aminopeptidase